MGTESRGSLNTLYLCDRASPRREEVLRAVRDRRPYAGLYLITFASNGIDQLDILHSLFLRQQTVRDRLPLIVGAAFGREEAFRTVEQIAADAYRTTGACDLKAFLLKRDTTGWE